MFAMVLGICFSARRAVFARGGSPLVHAPKAGALPVATKALSAFAQLTCQSPSCGHSFFLALSATGGARKRPQLRYIPIDNDTEKQIPMPSPKIISKNKLNVKCKRRNKE